MMIKMGVDLKLEEFSDWVAEPGRVRVPYKTWRILAKWEKDEEKVNVFYSPSAEEIKLTDKDAMNVLTFSVFTCKGFGKWVYDKFFSNKGSENEKQIVKVMGIDITQSEYDDFKVESGKGLKYLFNSELDTLEKWEECRRTVLISLNGHLITLKLKHPCPNTKENDIYLTFDKDKTYYGAYLYNKFFKEMEEKGEDNMKILNKSKFNFGTCEDDNVRMSLYGLAVKNAEGTWVSYDPKTDSIMDADILNFDGGKFLFKTPVALKDIKEGDIIIHNRVPMFVKVVSEDNRIIAVDPHAGEEKTVMLTKSCFGFDFATKVVSLFKLGDNVATPDAPFGNMLPFLLMGEDKGDIDPMAMCMMMQQNGDFMSNPMMMYLMLKNKGDMNDMLPFMFMMNANK